MLIDRLRKLQIIVHRVADRLRLVARDAAVISGQQHRPFGQRDEQRIEHFELHWNVTAIQRHRVDVGFQLPKQFVMLRICKCRRLEVCRQADVKHVCGLFRWTERLRIRRAERHQARREPFPYLGIGIRLVQVHFRQLRDPFEIGQGRHVHD